MIKYFSILVLSLFLYSCKTTKNTILSESSYFTDSIYSNYLKEYRKQTIYLPKNFNKNTQYPIVFATDGGTSLNLKKAVLDSLIEHKIIQPILYISSHCNSKIADSTSTTYGDGRKVKLNFRNFEYVNSDENTKDNPFLLNRFSNHMRYFVTEFVSQNEKKWQNKVSKEQRYFYGCSNGAGFGISLLNQYPQLIGTYLCFSTFGGNITTSTWKSDVQYPNLYLIFGTQEPEFLKKESEFLINEYAKSNSFIEVKPFNGGHDQSIWQKEFLASLKMLFPYKKD
jgi:enterochelin esterase-like enzyme